MHVNVFPNLLNTIEVNQSVANLRDRANLQTKDKTFIPKVSFLRRLDCITKQKLIGWSLKMKIKMPLVYTLGIYYQVEITIFFYNL